MSHFLPHSFKVGQSPFRILINKSVHSFSVTWNFSFITPGVRFLLGPTFFIDSRSPNNYYCFVRFAHIEEILKNGIFSQLPSGVFLFKNDVNKVALDWNWIAITCCSTIFKGWVALKEKPFTTKKEIVFHIHLEIHWVWVGRHSFPSRRGKTE